jgi:hypothetical protein
MGSPARDLVTSAALYACPKRALRASAALHLLPQSTGRLAKFGLFI